MVAVTSSSVHLSRTWEPHLRLLLGPALGHMPIPVPPPWPSEKWGGGRFWGTALNHGYQMDLGPASTRGDPPKPRPRSPTGGCACLVSWALQPDGASPRTSEPVAAPPAPPAALPSFSCYCASSWHGADAPCGWQGVRVTHHEASTGKTGLCHPRCLETEAGCKFPWTPSPERRREKKERKGRRGKREADSRPRAPDARRGPPPPCPGSGRPREARLLLCTVPGSSQPLPAFSRTLRAHSSPQASPMCARCLEHCPPSFLWPNPVHLLGVRIHAPSSRLHPTDHEMPSMLPVPCSHPLRPRHLPLYLSVPAKWVTNFVLLLTFSRVPPSFPLGQFPTVPPYPSSVIPR